MTMPNHHTRFSRSDVARRGGGFPRRHFFWRGGTFKYLTYYSTTDLDTQSAFASYQKWHFKNSPQVELLLATPLVLGAVYMNRASPWWRGSYKQTLTNVFNRYCKLTENDVTDR